MERNRSEILEDTRRLLGLRRSNPENLSFLVLQKRVARGKRWAKRNAPHGWHRNFIEPDVRSPGSFRAENCRNDESILTVMFEFRADLANTDGWVTHNSVANHFNLTLNRLRALGLETQLCHKRYPGFAVTNEMIDREWERMIRVFGDFAYRPYRHPPRLRHAA
ncbi:MAG TPA: hypothetical protein VFY28_03625 [Candidatus Paceibacterota bacterium]|nr:hypothetical protein [Candidatus Paceibacterota bacterium]